MTKVNKDLSYANYDPSSINDYVYRPWTPDKSAFGTKSIFDSTIFGNFLDLRLDKIRDFVFSDTDEDDYEAHEFQSKKLRGCKTKQYWDPMGPPCVTRLKSDVDFESGIAQCYFQFTLPDSADPSLHHPNPTCFQMIAGPAKYTYISVIVTDEETEFAAMSKELEHGFSMRMTHNHRKNTVGITHRSMGIQYPSNSIVDLRDPTVVEHLNYRTVGTIVYPYDATVGHKPLRWLPH